MSAPIASATRRGGPQESGFGLAWALASKVRSMNELTVASGSQILIGPPANPIHPDAVNAIKAAVSALTGVQEAHLPQCYIPGVTSAPAQVLVLVLRAGVDSDVVMRSLAAPLQEIAGFTWMCGPCQQATSFYPRSVPQAVISPVRS